jgi:hypothetical protein
MLRNEIVESTYNIAKNKDELFNDGDTFRSLIQTCDSILNESRLNFKAILRKSQAALFKNLYEIVIFDIDN